MHVSNVCMLIFFYLSNYKHKKIYVFEYLLIICIPTNTCFRYTIIYMFSHRDFACMKNYNMPILSHYTVYLDFVLIYAYICYSPWLFCFIFMPFHVTGIKTCVLVILVIFGIGHHWGHLCFTNTSFCCCYFLLNYIGSPFLSSNSIRIWLNDMYFLNILLHLEQ